MWYGAAYYPEHRDVSKWDFDLDNMAQAHINVLRVGEFAWTRFEPAPGDYNFEWMDAFQEKARQRGIRLLICPPLRTAPAWLVEQDPSMLIVRDNGQQLEFGSRYTFCINHPLLREKGAALAEAMARHYAESGIIGWHLDNEHGDEPDCHCPICKAKWHNWLLKRFGDIDALNKAWGMVFWNLEFNHFGQVPTPRISKTDHNPGMLLAWRQFRSDCTVEGIKLQADAVRKHSNHSVTTNFQALWNPRTDYFTAAQLLDDCGVNYYPPYGSNYRAIELGLAVTRGCRKQNFSVFELRNGPHIIPGRGANTPAPGELERLVAHTVANGADGIYFFRWRACPFGVEQTHGTITGYDGQPLRIFDECKETGARLQRLAPLLQGTQLVSDVAVVYDFPTRWYLENKSLWQADKELYLDVCKRLYAQMRAQGINVDVVGGQGDWSVYKVLVVPCFSALGDGMSKKLVQYVEQGGTLIWHPLGGLVNEHAAIYPDRLHPRLVDLFGLRPLNVVTGGVKDVNGFQWNGKEYPCRLLFELPDLLTGNALAEYSQGWFAGYPAIVESKSGMGRSIYIGTYPDADFYSDFFTSVLNAAGVTRLVSGELPDAIEVSERRAEDGRRLLFLLNGSTTEQTVQLNGCFRDIWRNGSVDDEVTLQPHGVCVLTPEM